MLSRRSLLGLFGAGLAFATSALAKAKAPDDGVIIWTDGSSEIREFADGRRSFAENGEMVFVGTNREPGYQKYCRPEWRSECAKLSDIRTVLNMRYARTMAA